MTSLPLETRALASRTIGATLAFALASVCLTIALIQSPALVEATIGRATPTLLLVGVAFGLAVGRYSATGISVLVVFIFLHLSDALVRNYDFPSLLQLTVAALAFASWLKRDTEPLRDVLRQPLTMAFAAYVLYLFVTTTYATDRATADDRVGDLAKALLLYLLATILMRNRARVRQGVLALVAAAAGISALVAFQVATGQMDHEFGGLARVKEAHIYGDVFQARVAGPIGDPNFFAQALLLALPLPILLAFNARDAAKRWACAIAAALIGVAILVTYSRGAMVAAFVMALLMVRMLRVSWRMATTLVAAALVVLVLLPTNVTRRFITIEQILPTAADEPLRRDSSFEERKLLMTVAWVMFGANPIFGVGAGNYSDRYEEYVAFTDSAARQYAEPSDVHYPHNLFLEAAAEGGLVGLALFGGAVFAGLLAFRTAARSFEARDAELAAVASALMIGVTGFLVASLFLHLAIPRHLLLILAFGASLERIAARQEASVV